MMEAVTKFVLGIEGGGSKTEWVFLNYQDSPSVVGSRFIESSSASIISKGQLPPSNLKLTSDSDLKMMFQQLPENPTHAGIFLAGCVTQQDRTRLLTLAREIWPAATLRVGSDRESALSAAFGDGDGITVISGTGSAVTGRKGGRVEKAGGRGHLLGDRGGAYVICIEALRLALRTYDLEHRTSRLAQAIMRDLGLSDVEELINWVQAADKTAISKLSPVVFSAALEGDQDMMAVIQAGAGALARYTESVANWLDFENPNVKLLGGIFLNQPFYAELFRNALASLLPGASLSLSLTPGSFGAARLAIHQNLSYSTIKQTFSAAKELEELKRAITEQKNPRSINLESLETKDLVQLLIAEEVYVSKALESSSAQLQQGVDLAVSIFEKGGRLFYTGAGTSGRLGVLDASEIPPTFGESPERIQGIIAGGVTALHKSVEGAEDDPVQGALAIRQRGITSNDLVCGITASGRTPFVLGSLTEARKLGAKTMLITCNPARDREQQWDVEVDLATGPEVVTGSTRMKAGTATKVALNILTTCSMIRLGKTRGSWMVELKPSNTKMRFRSIRLVSQMKGVSLDEAEKLLEAANWNIRKILFV